MTVGTAPTPALVVGTVTHVRHRPRYHEFTHRHSSWLVDLDRPPRLPWWLRPFAHVSPRDHLGGQPDFPALRRAVLQVLGGAGIDTSPVARVLMLAQARTLGWVFDPMTAYWALAADGSVAGAVIEVHSTFGEQVAYPVRLDASGRASMAKAMFVSPFNDRSGTYLVRMRLDADQVGVWIRLDKEDGRVLSASVAGAPVPAEPAAVVRDLARTPLMPMRVWGLIHLHALLLWRKRLPTYDLPSTRSKRLPTERGAS